MDVQLGGFSENSYAEFMGLDILCKYNGPVIYIVENRHSKKFMVYYTSKLVRHLKDKIIDRIDTEGYEEFKADMPTSIIKIVEVYNTYEGPAIKARAKQWKEKYILEGYTPYGRKKKPKYHEVIMSLYEWKNRVYNMVLIKDTLNRQRFVVGVFTNPIDAVTFMDLYYPVVPPEKQPFVPYLKKDGTLGKRMLDGSKKVIRQYITTVYADNADTKQFVSEYGNTGEWLSKNAAINPFIKKEEDKVVYTSSMKKFTDEDYQNISDEYFNKSSRKD